MIGYDASALEARVEGANTFKYDNGEYAYELVHGDIHTKNMNAWQQYQPDMTRQDAKAPKYGITLTYSAVV